MEKKRQWKCLAGHQFEATIGNRTRKSGGGCPVCSGKKILIGFNDLETTHPEIAKEVHNYDPKGLTAGSGKKVDWICSKKHIWSATAYTRIQGSGCPYCSGMHSVVGETDLATTHPELVNLVFEWDPKQVKAGSNKKLNWKCKEGHIWKAPVYTIALLGLGCPYCSGHQVLAGFNDLKTSHPELVNQIELGDPTKVGAGSDKKLTWKCNLGHSYVASVISKTKKVPSGCPICSGHQVLAGSNDLKTINPTLALEADGWDPTKITANTSRSKNWKCAQGHTWRASIASRNAKKAGCPKCSGRDVITGTNDLKTLFPLLAIEAYNWDPSKIMAGSGKKLDWKCTNEHIWKAQVASRTLGGNGCPVCSNQITLTGVNDMASTHPHLAKEASGWDPTQINAGSNKKVEWKCSLGHIWKTSPNKRKGDETNCPVCSGRVAWKGFNDLETLMPNLARQAVDWDPSTQTVGSGVKVLWKCDEGHIWKAAIYSRSGGNQVGCPTCSQSGFDPNKDGYLYFVSHQDWEMLQIGITNVPDDRLNRHKRNGWKVLELRGPMDGHLTQQWETAILRMLKAKGADLSNEKIAGKFDGYSEAWTKATFLVDSIKELMRLTDEYEENLGKGKKVES